LSRRLTPNRKSEKIIQLVASKKPHKRGGQSFGGWRVEHHGGKLHHRRLAEKTEAKVDALKGDTRWPFRPVKTGRVGAQIMVVKSGGKGGL